MNNFLSLLVKAFDEDDDVSMLDEQTIERCRYITMMNGKVIEICKPNISKQKQDYM